MKTKCYKSIRIDCTNVSLEIKTDMLYLRYFYNELSNIHLKYIDT
jgi:hypothetical protein